MSDLAGLSESFEAHGSDVVQGLLRKDDPSSELETWSELSQAFEVAVSDYVRRATKLSGEKCSRSGGTASRWPEALDVETARRLLMDWASQERWVDPESFANDMELSNISFAKYTLSRIVESRKELVRSVAGQYEPPAENAFTGTLIGASVPAQDDLTEVTYELHRPETVTTAECGRCRGSGRSHCLGCSGSGQVKCKTTERCRICHGSGNVSEYRDGEYRESRCTACHGSGDVTCPKCQGSGSVICSSCRGRGDVDCSECATTGLITTYKVGLIEREREDETIGSWPETVPKPKAARNSIPLKVKVRGHDVPTWIPQEDRAPLKAILDRHPREVYRELAIDIWPVTRVGYLHKNKARALFIIGRDRVVVAPAVTKRRRWVAGLVAAGLIVLVGLIGGALLALGVLGEDSGGTNQVGPSGVPTLTGQEIEELVRANIKAVEGSGTMPETTTCPEGRFSDGETVTCHFNMEDGRVAELILTIESRADDWHLTADIGSIDP